VCSYNYTHSDFSGKAINRGVLSTSTGPQIDVTLHSIFASRKRNTVEEKQQAAMMLPSNFQVYAKIDEESRKDSNLSASFLLTLNDARGSVTYEFRGVCNIVGSTADFEAIMAAHKDSRIPKILDIIYQRMYPVIFMLAGMTTSTYPQSIALLTEMVSTDPIPVHQEVQTAKPEEQPKAAENPLTAQPQIEAPKPTVFAPKKPETTTTVEEKPVQLK
jgi:hypothetical protein